MKKTIVITDQSGTKNTIDIPDRPLAPISPFRLSLLACMLAKGKKLDATAAVDAAYDVWKAANEKIERPLAAIRERFKAAVAEKLPFKTLADRELIPKSRASSQITTVPGVRGAVEAFYKKMKASLQQAIDSKDYPGLADVWKIEIEMLDTELANSLTNSTLPTHRLRGLIASQNQQRKETVSAREDGKAPVSDEEAKAITELIVPRLKNR